MQTIKQTRGVESSKFSDMIQSFRNTVMSVCKAGGNIILLPSNQPTGLTNQTVVKTILLFFISSFLFLPSAVFAFDFDGSLKGVTITDSSGTNQPPTAVINYTQNGDTFTFDAASSSDPDGSIVGYKWDFGGGSQGTGIVATHIYSVTGNHLVTLATVDNNGGVALNQIEILTAPLDLNGEIAAQKCSDGCFYNYNNSCYPVGYTTIGTFRDPPERYKCESTNNWQPVKVYLDYDPATELYTDLTGAPADKACVSGCYYNANGECYNVGYVTSGYFGDPPARQQCVSSNNWGALR